jgi:hypothetical protein
LRAVTACGIRRGEIPIGARSACVFDVALAIQLERPLQGRWFDPKQGSAALQI